MDISIRSCLTAGVATITAAAIAFVPSVAETPPAAAPPALGSRSSSAADKTHRTGSARGHGDRPAEPTRRVVATDHRAAECRPTLPDAPVPAGGRAHFHRQHHQIGLQRRRAVGAVGLRSGRLRRAVGFPTSAGWRPRSRSSTTSANASRTASRSTSPTGSTGRSASSRDWSTSASTPSTRSSSWPMTN